ncbi:MAG: hypothetical protein H0V09_01305 [Gemmatimonadetes bacterium]|nr:hypothetical protein [Gemmatimonadota bacterium]
MVHPTDAELQSLSDGELGTPERRLLLLHVDGCGECAGRLRSLQLGDGEIAAWLRHVDHPVPQLNAAAVMMRARRSSPRPGLMAAGLATLVAGAVAVAAVVPGSPLRELVERAVGASSESAQSPGEGVPSARPPAPASGVSFVPGAELAIAFVRSQPDGTVRMSLADVAEVRVRNAGEPAAFTMNPAELIIDNVDPRGSYEILLPRSLGRVRVRIDERVVLEKDGDTVSCRGSVDDRGRCLVSFAASAAAAGDRE